MDLSFPSLDVAHPYAAPLGLDIQRLIATCAALQAATPTAIAETNLSVRKRPPLKPVEALVELVLGGSAWNSSIAVLQGSFNPEAARFASDKLP